jgi:hypothetical protein
MAKFNILKKLSTSNCTRIFVKNLTNQNPFNNGPDTAVFSGQLFLEVFSIEINSLKLSKPGILSFFSIHFTHNYE